VHGKINFYGMKSLVRSHGNSEVKTDHHGSSHDLFETVVREQSKFSKLPDPGSSRLTCIQKVSIIMILSQEVYYKVLHLFGCFGVVDLENMVIVLFTSYTSA
jgi:hypothetical protein